MTGETGRDHDERDDDQRLAEVDRELQVARGRTVQLERDNRRLREENEALRRKLDAVYASETFRLGERLLRVPRALKQWLARVRRSGPTTRRVTTTPSALPPPDPSLVVRYEAGERADVREEYERIASATGYGPGRRGIAMAVFTTDLDEGRGDVYTAIGLARALEPLGYDTVLLPPERWYEPPAGTDVLVAMVAEPSLVFEPQRVEVPCRLLAWARNNTDRWTELDGLALFDAVLASSPRSAQRLAAVFDGPVEVLPIAVDADLFAAAVEERQREGALATINQWGPDRPRRVYAFLGETGVTFPLAIHGVQRGLPEHLAPFAAGPVSYFALPDVYARSAVVLDDQQDVNRRFGNVNSRIYEALAAGALPITGAPRGLGDAGLGELPSFSSPDELVSTVERWLADPSARQELVGRLRTVVLQRHTYAQRARQLDAFLRGSASDRADAAVPTRRQPVLLGFQPDYRATNPYQSMLYAALHAPAHAWGPVDDPGQLARSGAARGVPTVHHLHWTATILGPARSERDADSRADRYVEQVDQLRARGGRTVWTVHNVLPHDCRYPQVEARLRQAVADRCDAVHVLCDATIDAAAPSYRLPGDRVRVIPHGSYVDDYPNLVTAADARAELGVPAGATTYLFLGQIRPYKGLEDLLDAFEELASTDRDVRLVVAGKPVNHPGAAELERRCLAHPRITSVFRELDDVELQVFLNACDVVVLPHRRVLNSGGVQLAYAFGRPVVAPRTGCLAEQVTAETGLLFDQDAGDLAAVLADGRALSDDRHRTAAYAAARAYTSLDMARDFRALLQDLIA